MVLKQSSLDREENAKLLVASRIHNILKKLYFGNEFVDICQMSHQPRFCSQNFWRYLQKTFFQLILDYDVIIDCKKNTKNFLCWQVGFWLLFLLKIVFICPKYLRWWRVHDVVKPLITLTPGRWLFIPSLMFALPVVLEELKPTYIRYVRAKIYKFVSHIGCDGVITSLGQSPRYGDELCSISCLQA